LAKRSDAATTPAPDQGGAPAPRARFDKWLWAARFYKTRALAAEAIDNGQARLDDQRVKSAHAVRAGDTVSVRKAGMVWTATVTGVADRRGSAADAALLYRETTDSLAARAEESLRRRAAAGTAPLPAGRPTKRERRKLEDFLNEP
jgi:ribosome-associated heat shock protein Hsp15